MTRTMRAGAGLIVGVITLAAAASVRAQFGRGPEWTTSRFDAQRTAWVRTDGRLTKKAVQKGTFAFLWKAQFENESRQRNSLTEPILQDLLIGYRGFKALAFVGGSADRLFAIDTDLARPYWTVNLNYGASTGGPPPSTPECPGGLIAAPSRRTVLAPPTFGATPTAGLGRGGAMVSAVGEPGKGAVVLSQPRPPSPTPAARPPVSPAPQPPTPPTPQGTPRSGDVAPPSAAAPTSPVAPIPFGGVDPLYAMGDDGLLRTLRVSDGAETSPPVPLVPPSAKPSALIFVEGTVYTSTSDGCGAAPNAVWAIDLTVPEQDRKAVSWKTGGASIAGPAGLAFGTDGTVYVAVGNGPAVGTNTAKSTDGQGAEESYSNAVVALDRHTLRPKDWFTVAADGVSFNTSPTVIHHKDKDLIAATASDGQVYLLDGSALGGSDHKTPLFVSQKGAAGSGALATWDDGTTRWILAPAHDSIVAFKVVDQDGKISLEQGWQSSAVKSPLAPIVVNGMVMAASGSDKDPSVLYVLDGTTGKELWSSGTTITSPAVAGLSAGGGQVYLVTQDNHLYAFGIPMEH